MCDECGCIGKEVDISLTQQNDVLAAEVSRNLRDKKVFCVNILGAPGAGKTTVIEHLARHIPSSSIAVIQGDLESDIDKRRLLQAGIDTYQINTHSGCHLDARMVNTMLMDVPLIGKEFLFIENVGNLVCPAGVKIGQHMDIVISSTAEGSDKPAKYPLIFIDARIIIISKSDLAEHTGFDWDEYRRSLRSINPKAEIIKTCASDPSSFSKAASIIMHQRLHLIGHPHPHVPAHDH